jgi:predicted aldo/keto reductase-like oxidoreductase
MGVALGEGYRDRVVLMTKNHGRDARTFTKQLNESLSRLQTDRIDVLQLHEIIHDGEPEKIDGEGVLEAAERARDAGKIRFIGFTGHRFTYLFKEMLAIDFDWDTVQLPTNLLDYHYRSFEEEVMPLLTRRSIGIIGMKSLAGNGENMLSTGVSAQEAISYALSLPVSTVVSGMDSVQLVDENLRIAREFSGLSDEEKDALRAKVAPFAGDGSREKYKTA